MIPSSLGQPRLNWSLTPSGQWLRAAFSKVSQALLWPRRGYANGVHAGHSPCPWNPSPQAHHPSLGFKSPTLSSVHAIQRHSSRTPIKHATPVGVQEDEQLLQAAARAVPALAAACLECTRSSAHQAYRARERGPPTVFLAEVPGMAPLLRLAAAVSGGAAAAAQQAQPEAGGASAEELLLFASRLDRTQQLRLCSELGPLLLAATSSRPAGDGAVRRLPILFDTETQGTVPVFHRVVDICLLDLASGMEFSTLVFPGPRLPAWPIMPEAAARVNGISTDMLRRADVPSAEAVSLAVGLWILQRSLAACPAGGAVPLLIAHNAAFDAKMTGVLLTLSNQQYGPSWMLLCTLKLARQTLLGLEKHNLQALRWEVLGDASPQQHRAAPDVHLLARMLPLLLKEPSLQSAVQKLCQGTYDSLPSVSRIAMHEQKVHDALERFFSGNVSQLKKAHAENRAAVLQAAGGVSSSSSSSSSSSEAAPHFELRRPWPEVAAARQARVAPSASPPDSGVRSSSSSSSSNSSVSEAVAHAALWSPINVVPARRQARGTASASPPGSGDSNSSSGSEAATHAAPQQPQTAAAATRQARSTASASPPAIKYAAPPRPPPRILYAAAPRLPPSTARPASAGRFTPVEYSAGPRLSSQGPRARKVQQQALPITSDPPSSSCYGQEAQQAGGVTDHQVNTPVAAPETVGLSRLDPAAPGSSSKTLYWGRKTQLLDGSEGWISSSDPGAETRVSKAWLRLMSSRLDALNVLFDGPPRSEGPDADSGCMEGGPAAAQGPKVLAAVVEPSSGLRPGSTRRAKVDSLLRLSAPATMDVSAPAGGSRDGSVLVGGIMDVGGVGAAPAAAGSSSRGRPGRASSSLKGGSDGASSSLRGGAGRASSSLKVGAGGASSSSPLVGGGNGVESLTLGERLRLMQQAKAAAAEQAGAVGVGRAKSEAAAGGVGQQAGRGATGVEGEEGAGRLSGAAGGEAAVEGLMTAGRRRGKATVKKAAEQEVLAAGEAQLGMEAARAAAAGKQQRSVKARGGKQGAEPGAVSEKKSKAGKVEQGPEQEQEVAVSKRRTRAKGMDEEKEAATAKRKGRAKKEEQTQEAEPAATKTKGRARRVEEQVQEAQAETVKKARGRPKRAEDVGEAVAEAEAPAPAGPGTRAASSPGALSTRASGGRVEEQLMPAPPPPPEWKPCGVELSSKAASKWFPPAQLQKLRNAGFKSLLQVLMFYPKRHKVYQPALDRTLPRQDVALLGTTTKVGARMLNARCCMLSIAVEHQLPDADAAGAGPGATVVVNASVVALGGRWSLKPMMELASSFPKGSQVVLRGTLRGSGSPQPLGPGGPAGWTQFDCSGPELMRPEEFDGGVEAAVPVYATRAELKAGDFEDRGKRRGVISRALEVLEAQGDPGAADPLQGLSGPARRLLDKVVQEAGGTAGEGGGLCWSRALAEVHRPSSVEALAAARRSLAATEMLMTQLQLLERRRQLLARRLPGRAAAACSAPGLVARAVAALPYELTPGQATALREILADMAGTDAMSRLLQGDVGSGKTVVGMLAMLAAAGSGRQAAMLAPTEVLAEQHFAKLQELVAALPASDSAPLTCALLTSSTKNKKAALKAIAEGRHVLLVGTHSLLHVPRFSSLGLVVIDEQHKFGVRQKEAIARLQHAQQPHALSMSATPIPRTIALVRYGDMALSTLRETPPNRKRVATRVLPDTADARREVFAALRAELDAGGRAFIVYPLRQPAAEGDEEEEGDDGGAEGGAPAPKLDLRSAEKEFAALKKSKAFGKHGCALLHGGMSRDDKAAALASFRDGKTPALVCTIVIEVGVDVPDASMLVVEHADRFGLAQLHQLRGRVGRGSRQSHCFLLTPLTGEQVLQRLRFLETCHSGFDIAEQDLRFRGAGQVFGTGTRQSGDLDATDLCQEEIAKHPSIVEGARRVALLTMQGGEGPPEGEEPGSRVPQVPLPDALASAAAAFKVAVKRRPRQSSIFTEDEDEDGDEEVEEETLGIAV